jgi:hypothetical protein
MRCYVCKKYKFLLNKRLPIRSLLLFVRGDMCVKSMIVRDVNQEPLADLYALVRWPCVVPGIVLWKLIGRCLIRSWNLKRIGWNSRYLHVSLIWLAGWYKPYAYSSIHPLGVDQEDCPILSWGGASDQIENASSLAGDLSFLLFRLESPFDLCYWVRCPQFRERSAKCLMIWKDHWSWINPSHHIGLLGWAKVYICSDVVDFLKPSRTDPTIGLVLIAIGVEPVTPRVTENLN